MAIQSGALGATVAVATSRTGTTADSIATYRTSGEYVNRMMRKYGTTSSGAAQAFALEYKRKRNQLSRNMTRFSETMRMMDRTRMSVQRRAAFAADESATPAGGGMRSTTGV